VVAHGDFIALYRALEKYIKYEGSSGMTIGGGCSNGAMMQGCNDAMMQ
jgi:hypothetical protein